MNNLEGVRPTSPLVRSTCSKKANTPRFACARLRASDPEAFVKCHPRHAQCRRKTRTPKPWAHEPAVRLAVRPFNFLFFQTVFMASYAFITKPSRPRPRHCPFSPHRLPVPATDVGPLPSPPVPLPRRSGARSLQRVVYPHPQQVRGAWDFGRVRTAGAHEWCAVKVLWANQVSTVSGQICRLSIQREESFLFSRRLAYRWCQPRPAVAGSGECVPSTNKLMFN